MTNNRLGSHPSNLTRYFVFAALAFFAVSFADLPQASAQWTPSFHAPDIVTCIRWLQDEGARLTPSQPTLHKGVCGGASLTGGSQFIWYCPSGPAPSDWTASTIGPTGIVWNEGYISDFAFEDTMVGYASLLGASSVFYTSPLSSGILKTTDGGITWNFVAGAPIEVRGLYYDKLNGKLFASSADPGGSGGPGSGVWVSTGHGVTGSWSRITVTSNPPPGSSPYASRCNFTGFASWDDIHIVVATNGNACTGETNPPNLPSWLYSADGGLTWQASTMTASSWQPAALKGTNNFYASSNQNPGTGASAIYSSSDNGRSWRTVTTFVQTSSDVTEVMGGDPCVIVAPDSSVIGNLYSIDDGISWNDLGGGPGEPQPPIDLRSYVGIDSIWVFDHKNVSSIPKPQSTPLHVTTTTLDFPNSGCFTNDTVVKIFACNCTPPATGQVNITGATIQVVSGANNFTTNISPASNLCGSSEFHVTYTPNGSTPDASDITVNYTYNGTPLSFVVHATGAGAQSDFSTSWGSKPLPAYNRVILHSTPCQLRDTGFWIYNPTCTDFSVIKIDDNGDPQITIEKPNLPFTILAKGSMQFIRVTGISSAVGPGGGYRKIFSITTQTSGGTITKQFEVLFFVDGTPEKPFVRTFDITKPYPCFADQLTGQEKWDSAIYYFDTTCLPVSISNISLKYGVDFALDSNLTFPIDLQPFDPNTGTGRFSTRIHVRLLKHKKGTYVDTVIFQDQLSDGTPVLTKVPVRYKILNDIDYTPKAPITLQHFPCVTPCDSSEELTFTFQSFNPCGYPDTLSDHVEQSLATGDPNFPYIIKHFPKKYYTGNGDGDQLVIKWPSGMFKPGPTQRGYVKIWFKNGSDSNAIQFNFDGSVCTGPSVAVRTQSFPNIRYGCDTAVAFDTLFNNACVIDEKVDEIDTASATHKVIVDSPAQGDIIKNGATIPVHIRYIPTASDTGTICDSIRFKIATTDGKQGDWFTLPWCVTVTKVPLAGSVSTLSSKQLGCGEFYDTVVCIHNDAPCGRTLTINGASTTASEVTISNANWPQTIPPGGMYCFNVHFAPADQHVAGSIDGNITIDGELPFSVPFHIPYGTCNYSTTLGIDSNGRTSISTPRCVTLNDTLTITDSDGVAKGLNIAISPTGAYSLSVVNATLPTDLNKGDKLSFVVSFNPDAGNSGDATMVTISYTDGQNHTQTMSVPIKTLITGSQLHSQLALSSPEAPNMKPDMKQTKTFVVTLQGDPVPASAGVTELLVTMKYNTNILIPTSGGLTFSNGWSQGSKLLTVTENSGLQFSAKAPATLVPGTQIATIKMTAAVSDQKATNVMIDTGIYNPSDVNFTRCTLSAQSMGDMIPVTLDLACDSFAYAYLRDGKLTPADNISIIPNPAHKASGGAANLSFNANLDAEGSVDVIDMSGKTVAELAHGTLSHGEHIYSIPTTSMAEGTYFARIQIGGFTVVRKFVLQKD